MGALVWVVVDQFELSRQEMATLAMGAVLVVGAIIVCGAVLAGVWIGLRRFTDED